MLHGITTGHSHSEQRCHRSLVEMPRGGNQVEERPETKETKYFKFVDKGRGSPISEGTFWHLYGTESTSGVVVVVLVVALLVGYQQTSRFRSCTRRGPLTRAPGGRATSSPALHSLGYYTSKSRLCTPVRWIVLSV
ncbi:hypothetical protein KQX54_002792 [Cotesia glomerata]|uniref:Uncharacterized protein n=1 Tax=Cotesia glomerata TaxID=32391 RepID=A0AAV7IU34_COTGL|nr:hypothetical protein KQX54_002792 [Cotesia glomerata]